MTHPTRRQFLATSSALAAAALLGRTAQAQQDPLYRISLAQWSLHRSFFGGQLDPLDFAKVSREEFDIDGIEYVNQFYKGKAKHTQYIGDLKKRAADHGVASLLIMCDGEGRLGDPDDAKRKQAVQNHYKWVEAAADLGCHSIRVNAASAGSFDEQQKLAADGLARLTAYAEQHNQNVIVENHGGLSSNGEWLAGVMQMVNHPHCGTLPDFGNFKVSATDWYDRYKGVEELMPFAKAVSAKSHFFADGREVYTDYEKMMRIVTGAGYHGWVGIEWEGSQFDEYEGIKATKKLLEDVRQALSA
jgi:L-ribulose-5-phosphate 3-epimerase